MMSRVDFVVLLLALSNLSLQGGGRQTGAYFTAPVCFAPCEAQAQTVKPLEPDVLQHLNADKFAEIRTVKELPETVKIKLLNGAKSGDISRVFADPKQKWNSSCNQTPGAAPGRSFRTGGKSETLCLIYYEVAGFALVDTVDLYKLSASGAERVWSASMLAEHPETFEQLLKVVKGRIEKH
jgi:hypothetical protein